METKIRVTKENRETKNIKELFKEYGTTSPSVEEIRKAALRDGWPEKVVNRMKKPELPKIVWNGKKRRWIEVKEVEEEEVEDVEEVEEELIQNEEGGEEGEEDEKREEGGEEDEKREEGEEGFDIDEFKDEEEEETTLYDEEDE